MTQTIVLCVLVRDEVDVIADMLRWHLGQGVDHVIAMDNGSTDGTTEVLEDFAAMGVLTRLDQPSDAYLQDVWMTEMAAMARDRLKADWVIPSDADEFWMAPRGQTLLDALETVPKDVTLLDCARRNLCAPWEDIDALGWRDALIWRAATPQPVTGADLRAAAPLARPFAYAALPQKAILRPEGLVRIGRGGHSHDIDLGEAGRIEDIGITVFHVPFRAPGEVAASIDRIGAAIVRDPAAGPDVSAKYRRWHALAQTGGIAPVLAEILPAQNDLTRDRLSGRVKADTILRDALRVDRTTAARLALAGAAPGPDAHAPDPLGPPVVTLVAGGTDAGRAAVVARLHDIGVRPIDSPVDWQARIIAVLRGLADDTDAILAELRMSQGMHAGRWHGLLLDVPEVTHAQHLWRALRDSGDIAPALVLLGDEAGDPLLPGHDLPRLIAPAHRIAGAPPGALHAALGCLGLSVPLSVALASAPVETAPEPPDPALLRAGWGLVG